MLKKSIVYIIHFIIIFFRNFKYFLIYKLIRNYFVFLMHASLEYINTYDSLTLENEEKESDKDNLSITVVRVLYLVI